MSLMTQALVVEHYGLRLNAEQLANVLGITKGALYNQISAGSCGMLYVGRATDIDDRLFRHRKAGKDFQMFGCIEVPDDMVRGVESAYIEALDPCLNGKRENVIAAWQPAMVAAIQAKWADVERAYD